MINRKLLFIFTLLSFLGMIAASAQDSLVQKKPEHMIELLGEGYITSKVVNNDFIKAFYFGEFIDNALKNTVSGKLGPVNRMGADSKWGLTYTFHSLEVKGKPRFSFSFFDRANLNLKFSRDLFKTIFYGNKMFAGNTAALGNFKFNFLRYQQFRFGWDWKGSVTRGSYGIAFSLLSGDRNTGINALLADLFTAPDGTFLDLDLKMNMIQTDTTRKSFFAQNGLGLSADCYYELPYVAWKSPGKITIELKDLGFIRWKSNSMSHSVDSSFHFEGVDVSDIFNLDSSSFTFHIDEALDKNTKFEKKRYATSIPFMLDIHTKVFYGKKLAFEKGISCLFNTQARPYYYAKLHFLLGINKSLDVAYVIGYGGYGGFNSGLDIKMDFARYYSLHFIDNYLFSGLTGRSTYGMGAYLKLARRF